MRQTEQNESATRSVTAIRLGLPSVPEIRCLIAKLLLQPLLRTPFILAWSTWRQRHQFTAAAAHYRRHKTQLYY
jgi:hypothetical protein